MVKGEGHTDFLLNHKSEDQLFRMTTVLHSAEYHILSAEFSDIL